MRHIGAKKVSGRMTALISMCQELHSRVEQDSILVPAHRHCYFQGEMLNAHVFGLDGRCLGHECFRIGSYQGSGFGGQVYQALPLAGLIRDSFMNGAVEPIVLKVLTPRATWKRAFRDLLFRLSYQTSFAPRLREEALRCGLIWQELIRKAAGLELGTDSFVSRPYGYFWDEWLASFVEIHQWIESRAVRYEVDDQLLQRWLGLTKEIPDSEMSRKRACMAALVYLCRKIGAVGLARQYEWYTLVSQANLLTRSSLCDGQAEFAGVDWRPGLAVPFFLPLSPVHASIIWQGLFSGVYVHYDEVNFDRLKAYVQTHADSFEPLKTLIQQLMADDARYRAGLPDLWNSPDHLLHQLEGRRQVRMAAIEDWRRLRRISSGEAVRLQVDRWRFYLYFLLDSMPLIGGVMMHWLGDVSFRQHVRRFWCDASYRRDTLRRQRSCDLLEWKAQGRISQEHAEILAGSIISYLMDKIILSYLPGGLQRFVTDPGVRKNVVQGLIIQPVRLLVDVGFRRIWLDEILAQQMQKGIITKLQVERLHDQVSERRLQGFLRDLGLTIALELFAKLLYLVLVMYGLRTRNFLPLGIAAFGPIAPSGILRAVYVLVELIVDLPAILRQKEHKLFWTRLLGLVTAPWRLVGNLFAPLEMFTYYNEMSLVLGDYLVSKMVRVVPVLGGRGMILEFWAFNLTFNLPLSIRKMLEERVKG
jgi:hypothetical protein